MRPNQLSISDAGILFGVHRATLHRWLKRGWIEKDEKTGLITTDQIRDRLTNRRGNKGRAAGWAYKKARLSKVGDPGVTLERAVVLMAGILTSLSKEQRKAVISAVLRSINDPNLLKREEEPITATQLTLMETEQEQTWNNEIIRRTLKPKVHLHAPSVQVWGEKIKRRALLEEAGLPIPDALLADLDASPELSTPPATTPPAASDHSER